jgi:F-type H+-transporting ATPase subunit delta
LSLSSVSYRYAKGLSLIADETKNWEPIKTELDKLKSFFDQNEDVLEYLTSPVVPKAARQASLQNIVKSLSLENIGASFLLLLDRNKRMGDFSRIYTIFEKMKDERDNIERVSVSTASELGQEQRTSVVSFLNRKLDKKVVASFHQDKKLMEGIRIQIGSKTIENSVVSRMEQLRKKLNQIGI